jgi:hypothetical protein
METFLVILVLVVLVALFAYVAWLYMRQAGVGSAQLWLTGSQRIRQSMGAIGNRPQSSVATPANDDTDVIGAPPEARQLTSRDLAMALDDDALRQLKEEFQSELRQAVGRSREFDVRLTRIEALATETPQVAEQVSQELDAARETQLVEIERLQVSIESVKQRAGAWGERRGQALSELYGSLARVESALAAVVNPMLLPGEPLVMPAEPPAEAMNWNNWGDVGERAFTFGNIFNENRLVLDSATADQIESFIAVLRQALTGSVYPTVRVAKPTADQIAQMRAALERIAASLPVVRRAIEQAYRDDQR